VDILENKTQERVSSYGAAHHTRKTRHRLPEKQVAPDMDDFAVIKFNLLLFLE